MVYIIAARTIEDEVNKSNTALLRQVQLSMDNTFQDAQKLCNNIALNNRIQKFVLQREPLKESDHYDLVYLLQDLRNMSTASGYFEDLNIYFKNLDLVLSASTYGDSKRMYEIHEPELAMDYDMWLDTLQQMHTSDYLPVSTIKVNKEIKKSVVFMQSLPIENYKKVLGTVAVFFNTDRLQEMIKNIHGLNKGDVYIIDKTNQVIASTQSASLPQFIDFNSLKGNELFHEKVKNEAITVTCIESKAADLKYIFIMPDRVFMEKSQYINNLMYASIILCIIVGILIAFVMTKRNYNPVQELIKVLSKDNAMVKQGRKVNEYGYIQEIISSTLDENLKISKKLKQQNTAVKSYFLLRLLKGRIDDQIPIQESLSSLNIQFYSDYFAVMFFYIDDFGELFPAKNAEEHAERLKMAQFIISNIVEELAGQRHQGFMVEIDDIMACLVNFRTGEIEDNKNELIRIANESLVFIREKFKLSLTISVSNIHKTLDGIVQAYNEAFQAIEYKMVMGSGKIIDFDSIKLPEQGYYYPFETEQRLINCMKAGDFEKSMSIAENIFSDNFQKRAPSIQLTKCLVFDLASTIIKTVEDIESLSGGILLEKTNLIDRLINSETVQEMKKIVTEILRLICDNVEEKRKKQSNQFSYDIKKFIESSYMDMNLSISTIADRFMMTPPYVSRLFKEQTGGGLLDYINKVRLCKAKELLKDRNMNIKDVAMKVGYSNDTAITRAFKKYEGITPGQFKEM